VFGYHSHTRTDLGLSSFLFSRKFKIGSMIVFTLQLYRFNYLGINSRTSCDLWTVYFGHRKRWQNFPTYKSVIDLKFMIKETGFMYIYRDKCMPLILIGGMPVLLPSSPRMAVTMFI